jgi:hypothetical protein
MPMRRERLNHGLFAEEFVELTPKSAEASVRSAVSFCANDADLIAAIDRPGEVNTRLNAAEHPSALVTLVLL